jgi:hypothetical protein
LDILVVNGIMQLEAMQRCNISRQQLFAHLRSKHVTNLGSVRRLYLEACGLFSIYEFDAPRPGLPLFPPIDHKVLEGRVGIKLVCCAHCGLTAEKQTDQPHCSDCKANEWVPAIEER